jgi:hypothetical protein
MRMIYLWGFFTLEYLFGGVAVCSSIELSQKDTDEVMGSGLLLIAVFFIMLSIIRGVAKSIYASKHKYQTKICQCANGKFVVWHFAIGRYGVTLEDDGWEEWRWMPYGDSNCIWEDPLGRKIQYHDKIEDAMKLKAEVDAMYAEKLRREKEAEIEKAGFVFTNMNVDINKKLECKHE